MRLGKKRLFIIAMVWVSFAIIALVFPRNYFVGGFLTTSALFALGVIWWLRTVAIESIAQLAHQLIEINATNSFSKRIMLTRQNEITSIADSINQLLDTVQVSQEKQEERLNQEFNELQTTNQELKNEIAHLKPIAGKSVSKVEYLEMISRYDSFTDLPNRIYFNEMLNKSIHHAKRHNILMAILLVDIDQFKTITSMLSEEKANNVLKEIGKRFEKALRLDDTLAKLDGDEFIILLSKIDKPQFASIVAEKLLRSLSQPIKYEDNEFNLTASIGICTFPNDGETLDNLLLNVDNALYKAKAKGENSYQFYSPETNSFAHEYIQMETALHNAIKNQELVLYYQPKVNIKKGCITSLEALLRWMNPNLGIVYPTQFLSMADETGFFVPMAEWVIREACKINKYWQSEGYAHIPIAVNLTTKQFHHPEIANIISRALDDFNLNPKYLEIELDEKTVMEDVMTSSNSLFAIKATGVRISIDHFGVGYTSISYLKKFPISTIKIDSSFIRGVPNNPDDAAITSSFIALSHQLGIEVVAEGVETAEQVQYLSEQNCDLIQGYFLSHPLPAEKIKSQLPKLSEEVLM